MMDDDSITGAYKGDWKLAKDQLESAGRIKFHVLEIDAGDEESYKVIADIDEHSKKIPGPEFI